jgi:hypothetical protein
VYGPQVWSEKADARRQAFELFKVQASETLKKESKVWLISFLEKNIPIFFAAR